RRVQPHDEGTGERRPARRVLHNAGRDRDHRRRAVGERLSQLPGLGRVQRSGAVAAGVRGRGLPVPPGEVLVAVAHRPPERGRAQPGHGRLAGAHEPDQHHGPGGHTGTDTPTPPRVRLPYRAFAASRSKGRSRLRAARASSSSWSAGTTHTTSNSIPSGSLPYRLLVVPWSVAPTSAPTAARRRAVDSRVSRVSTSHARW